MMLGIVIFIYFNKTFNGDGDAYNSGDNHRDDKSLQISQSSL